MRAHVEKVDVLGWTCLLVSEICLIKKWIKQPDTQNAALGDTSRQELKSPNTTCTLFPMDIHELPPSVQSALLSSTISSINTELKLKSKDTI